MSQSPATTSAQSNGRTAMAAIMGTVQSACTTVSSSFGAANQGINMLNSMVNNAAARQNTRSKLDMHVFTATLHQEKSKELTESRIKVKEYIGQSPEHATFYEAAFNELQACL